MAPAESEQAMAQTRQAWQSILARYAAVPPIPCGRDPESGASLQAVGKVYDRAGGAVGRGKLTQAYETLEQARDIMAELCRRNGGAVFGDHMNAHPAEMEHVLEQGAAMTGGLQAMLTLVKRVGVLEYLARRWTGSGGPAAACSCNSAERSRGLAFARAQARARSAATVSTSVR